MDSFEKSLLTFIIWFTVVLGVIMTLNTSFYYQIEGEYMQCVQETKSKELCMTPSLRGRYGD